MLRGASRWDPPPNTWSNRAAGQRLARSNPFLAFLPNRTHPDESRLPSTPIQSGLLRDKDEFSAVCALAPLAVLLFVRSLRPDACVCYRVGILAAKRLRRPVISIGNLTIGGTGKTPLVLW